MEALRYLTDPDIGQLQEQGCSCSDWSRVKVAPHFNASAIARTHFSGTIELGLFDKEIRVWPGLMRPAGIRDAILHNCRVGNQVWIHGVGSCLSNLVIEDDVVIENVDLVTTTQDCCFGNGVRVAAINEAGGREVPIFDQLSAQLAYLLAFYRHRPQMIAALETMIQDHVDRVRKGRGTVGRQARIVNCGSLINCCIGPGAELEQVTRLENGTVNSTPQYSTFVGPGVIARDFIISNGAWVADGSNLDHCFVGEGTRLRQFTAEHCLFFANCDAYQGEACAVFAGPYTVTHHKASLLIASYASFMNAGSATNQSNHMYRLGPVHQGILERGCKTGSGAYLCFPAHIGAFSFIKGKHYCHPDTHEFPFSYLIEENGQSRLYPGAALGGIGLQRDLDKWPKRDRRQGLDHLDHIHFDGLGPFVGQHLLHALEVLEKLKSDHYGPLKISAASRQRGLTLYTAALDQMLSDLLVQRLTERSFSSPQELMEALRPAIPAACERWADLAGLYAPLELLEDLLGDLEDGHISELEPLEDCLRSLYQQYPLWRWAWAANLWQRRTGKSPEQWAPQDVIEALERGQKAQTLLARMRHMDAQRDFGKEAHVGYGLHGDPQACEFDFTAVRGILDQPPTRHDDVGRWVDRLKQLKTPS